jgi:4'-phosphopantetheinyl transferase
MNQVPGRLQPVVVHPFGQQVDTFALQGLQTGEVHVWQRRLECPPLEVEFYRQVLSPDEVTRARRFRFDSDRNEFIVGRGTLRTLLGQYLSVPPNDLHFSYSAFGRPCVVDHKAAAALDFNISHSGGMALLAFARGRQIGVDIERVRQDFMIGEIADRFFSAAERAALRELPEDQRHAAFFRCWTRKEAFIKALGEGLSHPLDQFDVSLNPNTPAALLATRPDANEAQRWTLWDIEVPYDYVAALVFEVV